MLLLAYVHFGNDVSLFYIITQVGLNLQTFDLFQFRRLSLYMTYWINNPGSHRNKSVLFVKELLIRPFSLIYYSDFAVLLIFVL